MAEQKVKRIFSQDERNELESLIRQKEKADSKSQKAIRRKIRKIGLRWEDLVGREEKFNLENFKKLFDKGILKVEEISTSSTTKKNSTDLILDLKKNSDISQQKKVGNSRQASDEYYVIDLCDEILGQKSSRQHRFDFLKGDTGIMLPVDAFYAKLNLVVEYHECQHTESVSLFDNKRTVSGVPR